MSFGGRASPSGRTRPEGHAKWNRSYGTLLQPGSEFCLSTKSRSSLSPESYILSAARLATDSESLRQPSRAGCNGLNLSQAPLWVRRSPVWTPPRHCPWNQGWGPYQRGLCRGLGKPKVAIYPQGGSICQRLTNEAACDGSNQGRSLDI